MHDLWTDFSSELFRLMSRPRNPRRPQITKLDGGSHLETPFETIHVEGVNFRFDTCPPQHKSVEELLAAADMSPHAALTAVQMRSKAQLVSFLRTRSSAV